MLIAVSPAKTLDYDSGIPAFKHTKARMLDFSSELVDVLKQKEPWALSDLMHISSELALLNANRYQQWKLPFKNKTARPAIFAFKGDVYTGLDISSFREQDILYAQQHLRILSGLYGVLRPLDLMMPYRLEMGTKLDIGEHKNLYQFWGLQITELLNKDLRKSHSKVLVNLSSNEYFKSVKPKYLKAHVVTPVFKDRKGDQYKVVGFWAKRARGLMARFIIQKQLKQFERLKEFNDAGYYFSEQRSQAGELVFLRDYPV